MGNQLIYGKSIETRLQFEPGPFYDKHGDRILVLGRSRDYSVYIVLRSPQVHDVIRRDRYLRHSWNEPSFSSDV